MSVPSLKKRKSPNIIYQEIGPINVTYGDTIQFTVTCTEGNMNARHIYITEHPIENIQISIPTKEIR